MKNANKSRGKHSIAPQAQPLSTKAQPSLAEFLDHLQIDDTWDILLFGDGSGSGWEQPCGWACVSIERTQNGSAPLRRVWYGGVNCGTVNAAEGLAYFQPLNWFHSCEIERCKRVGARRRAVSVHICTDSQYCRDMGNGSSPVHAKNGIIWAAYDALKRSGFLLRWHWIRRDELALNVYVDLLSKLSRGVFVQNKLRRRLYNEKQLTVDECNP